MSTLNAVEILRTLEQGDASRRQATEKEISDFFERLKERWDNNEDAQFRTALNSIREKLAEQGSLLEQLTMTPLAHAVVLYVDNMEVAPPIESLSLHDIEPGTMVRVLVRAHPFTGKIGRIVQGLDGDGDIEVNVDGEKRYVSVVRENPPMAEPLEGSADDFASFSVGKRVRIVEDDHEGKTGKIIRALDRDGDIRVEFDCGGEAWIRIGQIFGPPLEIITAPSRKTNSVVVIYEGNRIEVRYSQELLQAMYERGNSASGNSTQEFHIGDRVRIRRDSMFADQNSGNGRIRACREQKRGWVHVTFDDGNDSYHYRIGDPSVDNGACDLELVDPSRVADPDGDLSAVKPLRPGDIVKLSLEKMQIVAVVKQPRVSGEIALVCNLVGTAMIEVEYQGSNRVVLPGKENVVVGDRVVLDQSASIILLNLGKEEAMPKVSKKQKRSR